MLFNVHYKIGPMGLFTFSNIITISELCATDDMCLVKLLASLVLFWLLTVIILLTKKPGHINACWCDSRLAYTGPNRSAVARVINI